MKQRILVLAMSGLLVTLVGCSSTHQPTANNNGVNNSGTGTNVPIADQRLAASDFKKEGVKVIYNLDGQLEAIEVTGYAPAWGSSHNARRESFRVAELEAKKSINDFIHKETIVTKTSVTMISENLEHAEDSNTNSNKPGSKKQGNTGTADDLVAADDDAAVTNGTVNESTVTRNNAVKIASKLQNTITNSNQGILSGLYLKEGSVIDDGAAVKVVMRWDKKHNSARLEVGKLMAM